AVQMKRMVHRRYVDDVPDLQLPHPDRLRMMVTLAVDQEIHTASETEAPAQLYRSCGCYRLGHQRLDRAQALRNPGCRGLHGSDRQFCKTLRSSTPDSATIVGERFHRHLLSFDERADGQFNTVRGREKVLRC